jgi:hypothetical protein
MSKLQAPSFSSGIDCLLSAGFIPNFFKEV